MKILFIHQNFPGQFKNLAPTLAAQGHECVALTLRVKEPVTWNGVRVVPYGISRRQGQGTHPWLIDLDTKVIRAEACMNAAFKMKEDGFSPDVIVGHPGWGELLFLRDVWPEARIGLYQEFYYDTQSSESDFDPEFAETTPPHYPLRMRLKNLNNTLHYPLGDMGLSPTQFQASTFPKAYRDKITVIHDGIDTVQAVPKPDVKLKLQDGSIVTRSDEIITFVNRNLEPYRGYHIFMRALPELLKTRPNAKVLIVGGDGKSYGAGAPNGQSWKQIFIDEVRGRIPTPNWERVHFLGRIPYDDFLKLLQVSRVHIYWTYPFVLSWSLLEAMSCGAAIVASDTGPLREVISHGKTGRLVGFFDQKGMVEQVNDLLDRPEERAKLGQAARALILENYDLKSICLPRQLEWIDQLYNMKAGGTEII
jgi:glycosyltransferase involved in cell wall biosynthesis